MGVKYKESQAFPDHREDKFFGDLSIRTWGRGTETLFETLNEKEQIRRFLFLSEVGIERREKNNGHQPDFIRENITYHARFTIRGGNSFQLHLDTVDTVTKKYKALLTKIEKYHRMKYKSKEIGVGIEGQPLIIKLSREIEDIKDFLGHVISSKIPFRLWGLTTKLDEKYYKVKGVDLHNGDKYTLEVAPKMVRLYLPEEACGNTALRLFVNLQKYFDSNAEMVFP